MWRFFIIFAININISKRHPMKTLKKYEANDSMISIIRDNYSVLQSLGSFGIPLGFGDKSVSEVCVAQQVDTYTFLVIVNFTINGYLDQESIERLSVPTLLHYLQASHGYFLDFQLPTIRKELMAAIDEKERLARLMLKLYDTYAHTVQSHMRYEEKTVFPYVSQLLAGQLPDDYDIDTFSKHHGQIDQQLRELKSIIIKYLPDDMLRNNQLAAALYDIYNNEEWLTIHANVEDNIFIPAIRLLENKLRQSGVSKKISSMIHADSAQQEVLSDREKDIIVCLVQGMSNKEMADHLCISVNTVITHRRNIARKLQIHSPAGLTIYAIVNNLVDISNVKL